ncbi:anti-RssB factor [Klebsiella sp. RIT-PI-d]|uniref:anti-adapter protein IraP n=1 Tax=Klebsiella sp. RIT-PI-d TaxID=1681196 RepID=UPI000675C531|nr:anti-adapter protein IraP [Klebsiella sp. RIT-PI-d]KNC09492.1 anti-RssB factor [Klebsiella sp. RIT-PI-d]
MTNIILGMIAKISRMDAETKQLSARIEAQSLLLSAFLLTTSSKSNSMDMVEAVKKAINAAVEMADNPHRADAEILLNEFNEILSMAQLLTKVGAELDVNAMKAIAARDGDNA